MRIPRVHVTEALTAHVEQALPEAAAHHVQTVLRLRPGAELLLFDGTGGEYPAEVLNAHRRGVMVRVGAWRDVERESPLEVVLVQGISRGERMDYTLQKAVELGVTAIVPVRTERTMVALKDERADRRIAHWERVVAGACEQCGRNRIPPVAEVQTLDAWLGQPTPECGLLLVGTADSALPELPAPAPRITLLIGPEGGLSPAEQAAAQAAGYRPVRFGPRVLRTETAALVALAVLQSAYGDLG